VGLIRRALIEARGLKSRAAVLIGCDRSTINQYIKRHPELLITLEEIEEGKLDMAEKVVDNHLELGSLQAAMFKLKTKGKGRGYVEAKQLTNEPGQSLRIALGSLHGTVL
jgi:hypothetical protein